MGQDENTRSGWKETVRTVIFEADTPAGKFFDVALIAAIGLSVIAVMLDSVASVQQDHGAILYGIEWVFTGLFTVEYVVRLWCVGRPIKYATSFFGIVDLVAILPTYISVFFPGTQYLLVVRVLRVLRVFRILKIVKYVAEGDVLMEALRSSRRKITLFLFAIGALVIILGSLMYLIEGEENGFTSIPRGVYWAVVTLTTVGYGDVSPHTGLGQALAALVMVMGYSIIAVPTGIFAVEMSQAMQPKFTTRSCSECTAEGHDADALYCKACGAKL